jgi:hypothetical protein
MKKNFSYSEFSKIEEKAGCYCIYLDWSRIREEDFKNDIQKRLDLINAIFKVYTPNPIFVNATRQFFDKKQSFGESYSGPITYDEIRVIVLPCTIVENFSSFFAFLEFLQTLIIPLYIGKTKNLYRRLAQHMDYLSTKKLSLDTDLDGNEKEKFTKFSDRFSIIFNECKILGLKTTMISSRIVYLEESQITEFESNLNYIYKPLFGLR